MDSTYASNRLYDNDNNETAITKVELWLKNNKYYFIKNINENEFPLKNKKNKLNKCFKNKKIKKKLNKNRKKKKKDNVFTLKKFIINKNSYKEISTDINIIINDNDSIESFDITKYVISNMKRTNVKKKYCSIKNFCEQKRRLKKGTLNSLKESNNNNNKDLDKNSDSEKSFCEQLKNVNTSEGNFENKLKENSSTVSKLNETNPIFRLFHGIRKNITLLHSPEEPANQYVSEGKLILTKELLLEKIGEKFTKIQNHI